MKTTTTINDLSNELSNSSESLSKVEQSKVNGGLLLYCEEKRRTVNGKTYTTQQWKLANNGSLWLTIKM